MSADLELRKFVQEVIRGDRDSVSRLLRELPSLAAACFETGASRQFAQRYFLEEIKVYIYKGDTALHFAAAAYKAEIARELISAGADVHAKNRHGAQPLHAAVVGSPGSATWDPEAQVATIVCLIDAGADPNAPDMRGVLPLHRAVRTRCAAAVRVLLERGADPGRKNKSGSTPLHLAMHNTGRGGTGLPEAKLQQMEIVQLLTAASSRR